MGDLSTIIIEQNDHVAWVTLNRPEVLNAYNVKMRDELFETLSLIDESPDILVAVFRGSGERAFCAGADLSEFGSAPSQAIARQVRFERDIWARFLGIKKPLIAAVHGFCFGSGMEIILCCDLRIASFDAQFGLPETELGMIPAAAGTQTFPRIVGRGRALHSMLTTQRMSSEDAYQLGLVTRLVPKASLFEEAGLLAHELTKKDPNVLHLAKDALNRGMDTSLEAGLEIERHATLRLASSRI